MSKINSNHSLIVKDVARLMMRLRKSDAEELQDARDILQSFADSWLEEGDQKDLEGAGECCLSDTDTATALIPVLDVWIETNS